MPIDEQLANRIREALSNYRRIEEKTMFSGMCFMVNDKMCICVNNEEIMCRIDPALQDDVMEKNGTREMIHNKKALRGYVYVNKAELKSKKELDYWLNLCLDFNKRAKSSKKKAPAKKTPATKKEKAPVRKKASAKKAKKKAKK